MGNISESDFQQLLRNVENGGAARSAVSSAGKVPRKRREAPQPFLGPLEASLVLWGHCPTKKNEWETSSSGAVFIPAEVKQQIETLTTQALFGWKYPSHVEHPELDFRWFVSAQRQDQDGMYTTILDCLQAAGVLLNDNIKHNNGLKILRPCEFVKPEDERVEIKIVVKG